jgi:acyl-coenzyme A synthetase/AMP-(fatty) acid ligase
MHHIGISSLDFLRDPISFLVYLSKYRVNYYTQPNFAYHLLSQQVAEAATKVPKIDLSSLQSTVSGAEPIRADTVRQFMENYFQFGFDPKAFISGYGQAEHMIAVLRGDHMIYRDPFAANRFVRLPIIPASCTKKKQQPAIAIIGIVFKEGKKIN